ncbi:MAG: C4-dicarboxylate transporter [Friedmanniella sp.]|nr:C4-dicarboxylate transporter [Friedmanniella sp.]
MLLITDTVSKGRSTMAMTPSTEPAAATPGGATGTPRRKERTHLLYIAVIVAVILGIIVGIVAPDFAVQLKPLGTGFVALIKMMIAPVIFCSIVIGVGSVRSAAQVGKVGGIALAYFLTMSTVALAIGLVVGNILKPGESLRLTGDIAAKGAAQAGAKTTTADFLLHIIPDTLISSLTSGVVLQALLVALLVGFALQAMGPAGKPILAGVGHLQRLVFRVLAMIMWAAPIGAFGAIAAVVGATGVAALKSLAVLMFGFYVTCAIFVFIVLGLILKLVTGLNIFKLLRYLGREFLLIVSTSSSESALPRLIAKMEHLGVAKPTVGVVVPTGYSFNLDGTAIYLTMASLFVAEAMGEPLRLPEQISLLLFMMLASKGAAGVSGAGLATLAGGLASHRPELVDGVGLIVGIDRFMSEARAVTNFAGNAVATVLVGSWTNSIDREQLDAVLAGQRPFDETTMLDEHGPGGDDEVLPGEPLHGFNAPKVSA